MNSNYVARLEEAGMKMSGWSLDGELVEIIELPAHPWFVACQFHPEFKSRPRGGIPFSPASLRPRWPWRSSVVMQREWRASRC